MLASLSIKNVVLIDQLTIAFEDGLCALTGETGAGKSILLDSLGLALGARSDSGLLRAGADQAQVTAVFEISNNHPAISILHNSNIEGGEDGSLILRRSVAADGRSRAFINDQPVSVSLLKEIGETLVEIHGQFETQSLLNPKAHRGLLDAYAMSHNILHNTKMMWEAWKEREQNCSEATQAMERAKADEDYLRQAVEDLDALDPKAGEEERLSTLRGRLMRRAQILESLNDAHAALDETENSIGTAYRAVQRIGDDGGGMLSGLDSVAAEIQEVLASIQNLSSELEDSEYSLQEIDDRLFALKDQARKHHCDIDALAAKREELASQLNLIEHQDDALEGLMRQVEAARKAYIKAAEKVSDARQKAAKKLDGLVAKELTPLKLDKARFETHVESLEEAEWGPRGQDRVQFLVATNPGSAAGPLNKIASGGEMARFMLALKVVLAEVGIAGSLVFDEVDSGIGGATAAAVGERLARLARHRQILVVTHSPQVAAKAQHHWIVMKAGKKTLKTNVIPLAEAATRQEEIARMLSGAEVTKEARAAADKLLNPKISKAG